MEKADSVNGFTRAESPLRIDLAGGWEDYVGALYPGVKLIEAKPVKKQVFNVRRLGAKAEAAFAKMVQVLALAGNGGRCYKFAVDC